MHPRHFKLTTHSLDEAMTEQIIRRAGGRSARRSARTAPLADHLRPVRAGLEGGRFNPLSPEAEDRIHAAVLDALEHIGLADAPPAASNI